ncbi:MAG TPA: molecular chaperone DnaJ [Patescibacteria group bacterium]|nr:molecular chaperone DnaJ [Patescibacteria group bacterium]
MADYYSTLGIPKNASAEDIKRAYRSLAHKYHPDKGDKGDAEKFKQVSEAYQVLSDPSKRSQYDQFGQAYNGARGQGGTGAGPGFGGFDFSGFGQGGMGGFEDAFDIFSDIFGGGAQAKQSRRERGVDLEMEMYLTFDEAVFGVEREIQIEKKDVCQKCEGSGAEPGTKVTTCPKCHGTGQIRNLRRTIFGQMQSVSTCDRCEGTGKIAETPCKQCSGTGTERRVKTLRVKVPGGVEDGQRIRVGGEGEVGYRGSTPGDLYIRLHVKSHPKLRREGENVYSEIPISFYQAALGAKVMVETVDGEVELKVPAGTQSGKVLRLKGRGAPVLNHSGRGDQFVTVRVVTPTKLTKKEKEAFKKIAEDHGESVDIDENLWSKFTG